MGRKIKFRAWDRENETMLKWNRHIKKSFYEFIKHGQFIPMQYTGWRDKNKEEIYEGDVIKMNPPGTLALIRFEQAGFLADFLDDTKASPYVTSDEVSLGLIERKHIKVVGNRFENQELLEDN